MKKFVTLSIVLVLLLSLVVTFAIAGEAAETQKVKITYMHHAQVPFDDIYFQAAKDFMAKYPNVEIEVLIYAYNDLVTKIKTAILGGSSIDCFSLDTVQLPWFIKNDAVAEIMPSAFGKQSVQEVVDMWEPGSFNIAGCEYNGKYYGIPEELANFSGWVNTAFMKEAGLDPVKDIPKTWDEYADFAKKMTVKKNDVITRNGVIFGLREVTGAFWFLTALMEQKGLDWSTEQGLLESLDKPEAVEALKVLTDFVTKDKIWDPNLSKDDMEGFGNELSATLLCAGSWYWGVAEVYSVKTEDLMPFKYPRFADGKDIGGPGYGYGNMVLKQSKYQEWAWKWIDFLGSSPYLEMNLKAGKYQGRKGLDPELIQANIPYHDVFVDELSKAAILLLSTHYQEIQEAMGATVDRVISGGMSNEDSIKHLKSELTQILTD